MSQDNNNKSGSNWPFWLLVAIILFLAFGWIRGSIGNAISNHNEDKKSKSSSSSSSKKTSDKKESATTTSNKFTYNEDEAKQVGANLKPDNFDSNKGKSIELNNVLVGKYVSYDNALWLQASNDSNSPLYGYNIQVADTTGKNSSFAEGDIVNIKGEIQGEQKSMVTFDGDTDKYPTIMLTSIEKAN